MEKKIAALGEAQDPATVNTRTRFIVIKEEQAQIAKDELLILWTDYFKPEHLEKYPNLSDTFWKAAKLCSKNKTEQDPANGEALLTAIEEIHNIFWATMGRHVPFYRASSPTFAIDYAGRRKPWGERRPFSLARHRRRRHSRLDVDAHEAFWAIRGAGREYDAST
jgi:nickel superoxide dismutase